MDIAELKGKHAIAPKDPKTLDAKTKTSKGKRYKGKTKHSPMTMTQYLKEGKCFKCEEYGHVSCICPQKKQKKDPKEGTHQGYYFYTI